MTDTLYTYLKTLPLNQLFQYPEHVIEEIAEQIGGKGVKGILKTYKKYSNGVSHHAHIFSNHTNNSRLCTITPLLQKETSTESQSVYH